MWGRFIGLLAGLALLAESYVLWRPQTIGALPGAPDLGPFAPYRSVLIALAAVAGLVVIVAAAMGTEAELRAARRAKAHPAVDWTADSEPAAHEEPAAHTHEDFPPDAFVSAEEPEPHEALAPFPAADHAADDHHAAVHHDDGHHDSGHGAEPEHAPETLPSAFAEHHDAPDHGHDEAEAPHEAHAQAPEPFHAEPAPAADRGPFLAALDEGDRLRDADRLDEALDSYGQALAIAQARRAQAPNDGLAGCDLARAITSVGDIHDREGRLDSALDLHEESLAIRRAQATEAPDDLAVQRRLSIGLERLADTREARGHRSRARDLLRERLPLVQRLSNAAPSDAALTLDLKTTRERLAELDKALAI